MQILIFNLNEKKDSNIIILEKENLGFHVFKKLLIKYSYCRTGDRLI